MKIVLLFIGAVMGFWILPVVWTEYRTDIQNYLIRISNKRNPNFYLYKKLKRGCDPWLLCWDFISIFWGKHFKYASHEWVNPNVLLPELKAKRDVCINGFRFMLGIVEADKVLADRRKSVVDAVLNVLACRTGTGDGYNRDINYENDKIFVGEYQLLKTVKRCLGLDEYTFRDVDGCVFVITNEQTSVLFDKNLMELWKEAKAKSKMAEQSI